MDMVLATPYLSIKIIWRRPDWTDKLGKEEKRCKIAFISYQLQTIHPNPGPGRDKTEEGKKRRREGRYEKRRMKREAKEELRRRE